MASDTQNVKLGVCRVFFDGIDLGYTKGGVEVEVATETKKVEVDQFGKTPIDEVILGRTVSAKVPLAETTLENLVRTMPGAVLSSVGGAKASGTITVATQPVANDTLVVNGTTYTFKASAPGALDILIGANAAATAANVLAKLNLKTQTNTLSASYSLAGSVITVTYDENGLDGNAFTLAKTVGTGVTFSGPTLTGGLEGTNKRVVVATGIGASLLKTSKELRLHPKERDAADKSDDFVIPKANTPGAITFAYNLENERVYSTSFMGYPDPVTDALFYVGNDAA